MNTKSLVSTLMLILTAFIWGSAFVAQSIGMNNLGPYTFNGIRSFIGGLFLLIFIIIKDRNKPKTEENKKLLLQGGIMCGVVLFLGSTFQQHGIVYTTVGKAGFITTLYVIIVPVLGIFLKKKITPKIFLAMIIGTIGTYFLCAAEGFSEINRGDVLSLICALFFSIHILVIDYYSPLVDCIKLACIQLFVCSFISFFPTIILETPTISAIKPALFPLLYTGILSSGIAYTLQIVAQKNVTPVVASLICSLESVFSVICGWIILNEVLSSSEILGCLLVFSAVILAQIPSKKNKAMFHVKHSEDIL